jgi:serine/threonine protein kinase
MPISEQRVFARTSCTDDDALLEELEALLDEHRSAEAFMDRPLPELLGASAEAAHLKPGVVLQARYRISHQLQQGGAASVYVAEDQTLRGKPVIVKVLRRLGEQRSQEIFNTELKSLSRVQHPNVVGVSDIGTLEDGSPFLVLAFVPGSTLRALLQKGPLPPQMGCKVLEGIARGLAATHKAGFAHLDVKPENIIISEPDSGMPHSTLLDFGAAGILGDNVGSYFAGTPKYMAPEQDEQPSARCDIYTLSLVAIEIFTGKLPKAGTSPEPLPQVVPEQIRKAVATGLNTDPQKRFATAAEFIEAIQTRPSKPKNKRVAIVAAVASALVALGLWRELSSPPRFQPTLVVSTKAQERQPALSPNGEELYYTVGQEANQDIWKLRLPGGTPVLVAGGPLPERRPQVSPDGKYLIYLRGNDDARDIVRKSIEDSAETVLASGIDVNTFTIAPDGRKLVLSGIYQGSSQQLRVLDLETRSLQLLTIQDPPVCPPYHPRISPDGKYLALACRWNQGSHDLFVIPIDSQAVPSGKAQRITNRSERIDGLEWAPDSQSIFYISGALGSGKLLRVSAHPNREPSDVQTNTSDIDSISVARNAWKIAFSQDLTDQNIWTHSLRGNRPPTRIVALGKIDDEPALSPDGKMLLFASGPSGQAHIWVSDSDGNHRRQLTAFPSVDGVTAIWSPDSAHAIISLRSKEHGQQVFECPIQGPATLKRLVEDATAVSTSRDGKWLYLSKGRGPSRSIWKTPYGAPGPVELVADGGAVGFETLDGRRFCYAKRNEREGIWCLTIPNGKPQRVVESIFLRNLFAVGRQGIYFVGVAGDTTLPAIYFQKFNSLAADRLGSLATAAGFGFGVSPDEDWAVLTQVDVENYDITILDGSR